MPNDMQDWVTWAESTKYAVAYGVPFEGTHHSVHETYRDALAEYESVEPDALLRYDYVKLVVILDEKRLT